MKITEDFIHAFAGNPGAVSNGRSLAAKGKYGSLHQTEDGTLLFGSCAGSGKTPYQCSVDFADPEQPVARCSCPSRQIPCKHTIGLLFCYLEGRDFSVADLPDDVAGKRAKLTQRAEKKKEKESAPAAPAVFTKAKATAAIKKCRAQLEGVALAEKILHNMVLGGLGSIDRKNQRLLLEQIKELGNYYIGGIQAACTDLVLEAGRAQQAQSFTAAVEQVNYVHALLKKSAAYLNARIADLEAFPDMTDTAAKDMLHSAIEEQMGYAWKLDELREKGLVVRDAALIQVGFDCYSEEAKRQWVDEGLWMSLLDGNLYVTRNYRPYKAQKHVREEDSFFPVLLTPELMIYPGDQNPRVRWEKSTQREVTPDDLKALQGFAKTDFAAAVKEVKGQIRSPLADKNPIYALRVARLGRDQNGDWSAFDQAGTQLPLALTAPFAHLLPKVHRRQAEGQTLVCRFAQDMDTGLLLAHPLALITEDNLIRFTY